MKNEQIITLQDAIKIGEYHNSPPKEAEKQEGKDKEILLTLIETSIASLKFWLPISAEGDGNGDIVVDQFSTSSSRKINWGQMGYADVAGAAWASCTSLLYQLM